MKALDLFSGYGGTSDGLALEGFEILGVEYKPDIAAYYMHPVLVCPVEALDPAEFQGYDLIVGSPPCRDFTRGSDAWWKEKKSVEHGLKNVHTFLNFIDIAKPKYWMMENVRGLIEHIEMKPRGIYKLSRTMYRAFWGNYPSFLVPLDLDKPRLSDIDNWSKTMSRQNLKAKIPLPFSRALGKAVREAIENESSP